ncbi:stromal interaction molecule homolog isoform X1 [Ornithodoros turicata]|uniref:stromal interaction molecule homolog isoform X1 n=1 Tax=Ornithodoros turicata TaxID=34597 RepID=UPI003138B94B
MNLRCLHIIFVILFLESITAVSAYDRQLSSDGSKSEKGVLDSQQVPSSSADDTEEGTCEKVNACDDKLGYEAIKALHHQLDDDDNGNVDVAETDEFLRDELQYENGYERQKGFHGNDKYISVEELWQAWQVSEVHNWTVEDTIEWLVNCVELPQYVKTFEDNSVDGSTLPRMAVANNNYLSSILGIKDVIHKQKLTLKAMDVVLFGPPKHHNYVKDVLLVMSLVIATGGCWFAYVQHNYSQSHLKKMMKDMDSLQKAEEALSDLQRELDKAKMEQETAVIQKQRLEDEILAARQERELLLANDPEQTRSVVEHLQEEVRLLREQLSVAQAAVARYSVAGGAWVPPTSLQHWLQLTHELELRHYNAKKAAAEKQLLAAKEGCEKLRRKRSSFMGSFRIAHGSSIDDIDSRILQAKVLFLCRAALSEVTKDLQERLHRWKQIERLCGFPIVHNPGIGHLEALLRSSFVNGSTANLHPTFVLGKKMTRSESEGAIADDDGQLSFAGGASAVQQLVHNSAALFLAPVPPAFDITDSVGASTNAVYPFRILPINNNGGVAACSPPLGYCNVGSVQSMSSLFNMHCAERPSTLPVSSPRANGSSTQRLVLLDETEDDDDVEEETLAGSEAPSVRGTTPPEGVIFSVGDTSPSEIGRPPKVPSRTSSWLGKSLSQDHSSSAGASFPTEFSLRKVSTVSEPMLHMDSSPPSSLHSSNSPVAEGSFEAATLPRPPVDKRRKPPNILVAAFKGVSGGILDEENSTDSNSTADDDSLREKKKKVSLFQPLKKKKSKVA